jgi:signal transduction histidine kinase
MADLYEPSMSDKNLRLAIESRGPVTMQADAALMHRMISNLFDNELKHLPAGCSVHMRLGAEQDQARLTVEDDGPGFAPEILPHLFERRVKGRQSSGHGLGLAFVEAVARAHGGSVAASNREEGGARLVLTLPRGLPQEPEAAMLPVSASRA